MSDSGKAVFLSYASQDAEAAKRICEALRAAGVEVWFDQSELVGGDAWDQKIRKQIKECALLIPVISQNTQARTEGYFRLEWRLADQRTHLMAKGRPFLLPVVIDETRDSDAHVPDSFTEVQWTRLPAGETTAAFAARVSKLLGGSSDGGRGFSTPPSVGKPGPQPADGKPKRWLAPVIGAAVVLLAVALLRPWEKGQPSRTAGAVADSDKPAATVSEARQLVAKARVLLNKPDMARAELDAADALCKRAAALDPTDAEVWAAWAQVNIWYGFHRLDSSPQRQEAAREYTARALQLDSGSFDARLTQALYWVRGSPSGDRLKDAEELLRKLLQERPDEPRALFTLGFALVEDSRLAEGVTVLERLARNPDFAAVAWQEIGWSHYFYGDQAEADVAADRSIAALPYWNNLGLKITLAERVHGDMDRAESYLNRMPATALQEDWGIGFACEVYEWRREPLQAIRVLEGVNRDWIRYFFNDHPKAFLLGQARLRAGQTTAAQRDFRRALVLIDQRLADDSNDGWLLGLKACALRYLGETEESAKTYAMLREIGDPYHFGIQLAQPEEAIADIKAVRAEPGAFPVVRSALSPASLRLDPDFDRLRNEPAFQALLTEPAIPTKRSDEASVNSGSTPPDSKSVAVLAFTNLSDDKANEYFSDGISEELLNVLAKIPDLKVAARTSAFYFKGKEVPVPEIARQLGVAYVVEGSVRKSGDRVRITAQLIKAADGFHVWSDTFTRDLKDIFSVQDEIAGLIAKNLELKMGVTAARPTVDLEAYQEYLAGRAAAAKAGNADLEEAVRHFEKAVGLDPKFTAAWVQLARAHTQLGRWGNAPTLQSWQQARIAIDHARSLEPDSPDMLLALGWILRTADWDWRGAEQAFRRSLEAEPNQSDTLAGLAVLLFNVGRTEEAFRLGQQAALRDPLNPATQIDLSLMYYFSGKGVEAERAARRALQLAPGGAGYHSILAWAFLTQRRFAEAEAEAKLDTDEIQQAAVLGTLAVAEGHADAAREQVARLEEISRTTGDRADLQQTVAWIRAGLGEKDLAFAALDKARVAHDPSISWLRNTGSLAPLYSDPRWNVLLHQVGLADDQLAAK